MTDPSAAAAVFERVARTLRRRNAERPAASYATQLFNAGLPQIEAKLREELDELLAAARSAAPREQQVHEGADVMFHLFALLEQQGIAWTELAAELAGREGTSGLDPTRRRSP